ncbi:MAG: SLBB domain-containing protein [Bacteroidota bacterium]
MKNHIFIFFLLIASTIASAQVPTDLLQAKSLLASKGITEQELKDNLAGKGIDVDNISPADLPSLQGTIEQAVAEIEAEKGQKTGKKTGGGVEDLTVNNELSKENLEDKFEKLDEVSTAEVGVKVETGASVEEAISDIKADHTNTEKASPIYGHSIFFDNTLDFYRTTQTSSTPDHYILDVGDKVTINIFGKSQADLIYQIENDGFIRPSGMYKINLKGVQFGKAKELLFKRFQQAYVFNRGQFNVELNTARTISVSIYGEVNHPGTYTISAFNNALGAIMAAGGPTGKASVRNIKLLSKGKEKLIDVYAFLNNPTVANSYGLTNNNVIYVQTIENRVSLSGPFLKSGTFELKTTENLADLIALAGGTRQNSILDNFNVVRVDGAIESLFTYDYETNKDLPLKDLDQISFKSTKEVYRNVVRIAGAVKFAGEYEVTKGLTLGELFNKAKLEEFARTDIAYVTRKNIDGTFKLVSVSPGSEESAKFLLRDEDQITILNQRSFITNYFFSISGAVRNSLDKHFIDPDKTIRLSDAVLLAGGIQPNATDFAYLTSRKAENSLEVSYQMLDLKEALSNPGGVSDIVLSPYDQIVIPATENFQDSYQVSVMGSVRNPGSFSYDKTLTLKDLIVRSGGFQLQAATNKIDIFRLVIDQNNPTQTKVVTVEMDRELNPISSTDQIELQPFDMVVVRDVSGFSPIEMVTLQGEVKYPGQYAITRGTATLAEVIAAAGGLTKEAYLMNSTFTRSFDDVGIIRMNFKKALKRTKNKNHNIALRKNDVITIGKTSGIVLIGVSGTSSQEFLEDSVAKIAVPFYPGKVASYYIQHYAGGFKRDSRPSQTYVKHLDGTIKQAHNFLLFRVQRRVRNGSEIIISQKKEKQKQERRDRKKEESKLNLKDTVTEILTLMISAFTVVTLSNNL